MRARECDIVLLDVMMPDMDGFEVGRKLKSNPATHHIPVVMVTALDQRPTACAAWRLAPTIFSPSQSPTSRWFRACARWRGSNGDR